MTEPRTIDVTRAMWRTVTELCRDGAGNRQIGRRLGVTENTAKRHLHRVMTAAGMTTRAQLAVAVLRGELVLRAVRTRGNEES
jgi:DNA-binding NarL/FixJ family response regulator